MARRPKEVPDWFDLANYDCLASATLDDWILELSYRRACFLVLSCQRTGREVPAREVAFAEEVWNRIRAVGALTAGRHGAAGDSWIEDNPPPWKDALTPKALKPLTRGDVVARFLAADELGSLANPTVGDLLSTAPMEEVGARAHEQVRLLQIDLLAPVDLIKARFADWLAEQAPKGAAAPKLVSESDFARWQEQTLLPYLDLDFAKRHDGINFSQWKIGEALAPDREADPSERVRKVIKPRALELISDSFVNGLLRQREKRSG